MEQKEIAEQSGGECPICCKTFSLDNIETHVNRCIFLNSTSEDEREKSNKDKNKRSFSVFNAANNNINNCSPVMDKKRPRIPKSLAKLPKASDPFQKEPKESANAIVVSDEDDGIDDDKLLKKNLFSQPSTSSQASQVLSHASPKFSETTKKLNIVDKSIPLAEKMRPESIDDYIGQTHIIGKNAILRKILDKNETPSMILWGPPGVGKTTLAHIIANKCKLTNNIRFVKLSATLAGVSDIKQAVAVAKNEQKFQRKTILFMDEIHRFNKLQQDIFLPHVESGTITLIGATTENPSFTINSALLSRCRVIVLEKLSTQNVFDILKRSLKSFEAIILDENEAIQSINNFGFIPKIGVEETSLKWLAEISDGDARIALNSLQLAMEFTQEDSKCNTEHDLKIMSLNSIKDGIKRSHMLYDRKGDQHYDMISALHKSVRASDDNAALYWCTRMMAGGEDPRYICRRLVRAASEDIGLADPNAVSVALSALNAVQLVGMPESDCIIAQAAVYLARAPKSREVCNALDMCKKDINEWKGAQPAVPLHLRNAPTKLMKQLDYGKGYNLQQKDVSGLEYMPEGMESREYF